MTDYISREAALEVINGIDSYFAKYIEAIPAADVEERKTGKWEERKVSSDKAIDEWQSARCSECGRYHTTPYMYFFDNYKFCPNCGSYNGG